MSSASLYNRWHVNVCGSSCSDVSVCLNSMASVLYHTDRPRSGLYDSRAGILLHPYSHHFIHAEIKQYKTHLYIIPHYNFTYTIAEQIERTRPISNAVLTIGF